MLSLFNCVVLGPSCSGPAAYSSTFRLLLVSMRGMRRKTPPPGKPPIVPPAKRVLFHCGERPWMDPRDVRELLWRRHVYNNAVVSLRRVFKAEIEAKEAEGLGIEGLKKEEEEEFEALLAINAKRNEEVSRLRKMREKEDLLKLEKQILDDIEIELDERKKMVEEHTKEVLEMIERSKNFVTRENLDEKLWEALENPVVYDFALNLQGQKFYDPPPVKYLEGTPPRQTGRIYDVTLGSQEHTAQKAQ